MTTTTTPIEAFMLCQKHARGALGKTLEADQISNSAAIGVVDDASEFGYTFQAVNDRNALGIWRYAFDNNDEFKRITGVYPDVAGGRVTVESAWIDIIDKNYVLIGIEPAKILDAMLAGYSRLTLKKDVVLTIGGSDLDMERDDAFFWNQYLTNCTVLKEEADPENKVTGDFSLKITLSAASGKLFGPAIRAVPGDKLITHPCLRVQGGGPFTVRLYDFSNGAYFEDVTQSYAGAEFAYLKLTGTVPSGCDYWQVEIKGTDNGAVAYLDSVAARASDDATFNLEDWIDENYKLPLIHRMQFTSSIQGASNQYAATKKRNVGDLVLGTHYRVQAQHTEANRYVLDFEVGTELGEDVFYLATRRNRQEVEPWDSKTALTTAPRGELTAYLMYEICGLLEHETGDAVWARERDEWGQRLGEEAKPRMETPYTPPRTTIIVKAGSGSW